MSETNNSSVCNIEQSDSVDISRFNVAPGEYFPVIHKLSEFWKTQINIFPENAEWPILLIFKEIHSFWWQKIRDDNIRWFMAIRESVDFITTEWGATEFTELWYFSWGSSQEFIDYLKRGYYGIASEAIEDYYKKSLDTCWIDLNTDELDRMIEWFSRLKTREEKEEFDKNIVINPRNTLWLENISKILKKNGDIKWKNAKGIVPIFAWWDHTDNLMSQAKERWFKWAIIFESNDYAAKRDKIP